jgi:hypothetical protein
MWDLTKSQDSSVDIVTGYGLDDRLDARQGRYFSLLDRVQTGPPSLRGAISPGEGVKNGGAIHSLLHKSSWHSA